MKLSTKILITYAIVGTLLLLGFGYYASVSLRADRLESIHKTYVAQLHQVDFSVTTFLVQVRYDVLHLVSNATVRTRDDSGFTSFLDAVEETFEYDYGPTEQAIIEIFNAYRLDHPYVNSVYMGRENGSFVRSHPRARPTQYDPRQRPWYELAASNPDQVLRTAPYRSVTTPDVNIGTVKALVDEQGQFYGVVGVDVTLRNLTDFLSNFSLGPDTQLLLLDDTGIVLTGPDEQTRSKRYDEAGLDHMRAVMEGAEGYTSFQQDGEDKYLFYYTSPELGWKITAAIPYQQINRQVTAYVARFVGVLVLSLLLLSWLTVLAINHFVVRPIEKLQRSAKAIIQTGDLTHGVSVESNDEVGQLAAAFNEMVGSINRAAEELQESEEQYRSLVENVNAGVFRSTVAGRLMHANPAAIRIMGYDSITEAMAVPVLPLLQDPHDREEIIQRLENQEEIKNHELRLIRNDGTPIWISLSVTGQSDEEGRLKWLDGVFEDITARKEAEDALRRTRDELEQRVADRTADLEARNAELDAFIHTVAHDIKSPVAYVTGFAEVLEQEAGSLPPATVKRALTNILRGSRKMSNIVDELLLLAQVRSWEEIDIHPLDMGTLVGEAIESLLPLIEETEGEIVLPKSWPVAMGYSSWIEEVWLNYISNALKYGGHPPRVELGASLPAIDPGAPSMVRFWVRDNGPGLSPEEQASLFAPFERLNQVRVEGHGLGLSIVQRIVHRLGGEVGVESPSFERAGALVGSTFYFTLPAAAPSLQPGPPPTS